MDIYQLTMDVQYFLKTAALFVSLLTCIKAEVFDKSFLMRMQDLVTQLEEVRELSCLTGRGRLFGGGQNFWGGLRGAKFFSRGQRGRDRIYFLFL